MLVFPFYKYYFFLACGMAVKNFKETKVYKLAFEQAMLIFEISKFFPIDEKYSLSSKIRRSSRSICANLAEAYRKKKYQSHFILKISDSDAENSETNVWIEFSFACKYISEDTYNKLLQRNDEIGRLLYHMANYPEKY